MGATSAQWNKVLGRADQHICAGNALGLCIDKSGICVGDSPQIALVQYVRGQGIILRATHIDHEADLLSVYERMRTTIFVDLGLRARKFPFFTKGW